MPCVVIGQVGLRGFLKLALGYADKDLYLATSRGDANLII